jgi:hypothetical protein
MVQYGCQVVLTDCDESWIDWEECASLFQGVMFSVTFSE